MCCIEYLLQCQVDVIIVFILLLLEYFFYQCWVNDLFLIVVFDCVFDCEYFISVVGVDWDDVEMFVVELWMFSGEMVFYFGVLLELLVSFLCEQGFCKVWQDDLCEVYYFYVNSYECEVVVQLFEKWFEIYLMLQVLFIIFFLLLQGVMDVILCCEGKLFFELVIVIFGDNELFDFLQCLVLVVVQCYCDVVEWVLEIVFVSFDEFCKLKLGFSCICCNFYCCGSLNCC